MTNLGRNVFATSLSLALSCCLAACNDVPDDRPQPSDSEPRQSASQETSGTDDQQRPNGETMPRRFEQIAVAPIENWGHNADVVVGEAGIVIGDRDSDSFESIRTPLGPTFEVYRFSANFFFNDDSHTAIFRFDFSENGASILIDFLVDPSSTGVTIRGDGQADLTILEDGSYLLVGHAFSDRSASSTHMAIYPAVGFPGFPDYSPSATGSITLISLEVEVQ